ncbi:MAG: CARDB domain-containing protein, partial [Verrucomicrobiota bacterium]
AVSNTIDRGRFFDVTIRAESVDNLTVSDFTRTVNISGTGNGGPVTVDPTISGSFVAGIWTGEVAVNTFDTNVVLRADDPIRIGLSNPFDLVGPGLLATPPDLLGTLVVSESTTNQSFQIRNIGNATMNYMVQVQPVSASWLSTTAGTGSLAPGASTTIPVMFDAAGYLPGDVAAGGIDILVNDFFSPSNEIPVTMVVVGPDLVVDALTPSNTMIKAGDTFEVGYTITNRGYASATFSLAGFYLSRDTTLDPSDILFEDFDLVPILAPNTSASGSIVLNMPHPSIISTGQYYIIAEADFGDGIIEGDKETNNLTASIPIQVTFPGVLSIQISPVGYPDNPSVPLGEDVPMMAIGFFEFGYSNDITDAATWISGDPGVITMSATSNGLAESVGVGTGTVQAALQHLTSSVQVITVAPPIATNIVLLPRSLLIASGADMNLTAIEQYSDGSSNAIAPARWVSANSNIVTVDEAGTITGVGAGMTVVVAVSGGITSELSAIEVQATISGTVNTYLAPLAGADIVFNGPTNGMLVSGPGGAYATPLLPAGVYTLVVSATGYTDSVTNTVVLGPSQVVDLFVRTPKISITPDSMTNAVVVPGDLQRNEILVGNPGNLNLNVNTLCLSGGGAVKHPLLANLRQRQMLQAIAGGVYGSLCDLQLWL